MLSGYQSTARLPDQKQHVADRYTYLGFGRNKTSSICVIPTDNNSRIYPENVQEKETSGVLVLTTWSAALTTFPLPGLGGRLRVTPSTQIPAYQYHSSVITWNLEDERSTTDEGKACRSSLWGEGTEDVMSEKDHSLSTAVAHLRISREPSYLIRQDWILNTEYVLPEGGSSERGAPVANRGWDRYCHIVH